MGMVDPYITRASLCPLLFLCSATAHMMWSPIRPVAVPLRGSKGSTQGPQGFIAPLAVLLGCSLVCGHNSEAERLKGALSAKPRLIFSTCRVSKNPLDFKLLSFEVVNDAFVCDASISVTALPSESCY